MAMRGDRWKLEDAKARFSEVVRRANDAGPQRVTVRGRDRAVVLSADEYERLRPATDRMPLVAFMETLSPLADLDLTRAPDVGRDAAL